MAHFAKIENNIVTNVIVISNDVVGEYPESESTGQEFIHNHNYEGVWIQTSYNGNFRKQFARIGYTYDAVLDKFISEQPFASWSLDSDSDWQPPVPQPEGFVYWDEESLSWLEIV
jgi:hypothetical protein